ncbi:hypothetical protein DPMN_057877 [Dreissena polymorpha]|uniref:Uncharacterized protein n=1 Tax=Dreissena polymorpha TaxID=45954 RepID=A0A9D4C0Z4_DREPO|nr:hypothetical protein DPMN_057877 [Dreissena polymorpha]
MGRINLTGVGVGGVDPYLKENYRCAARMATFFSAPSRNHSSDEVSGIQTKAPDSGLTTKSDEGKVGEILWVALLIQQVTSSLEQDVLYR